MGSFSQSQWPSWAYSGLGDPFSPYAQLPSYPTYLADSMETYQTHHNRHLVQHQMSRATESKPRLSKEEVELLEAEFQKNHKPSSSTKKALAESMRVDNARINNWFQNRRAREKKENNIREYEAKQRLEKEKAEAEPGNQFERCRKNDWVVSSAPFPEARGSLGLRADAPPSPSAHSVPDASSETTEPSQAGDSDSPRLLPAAQSRPTTPGNMDAHGVGLGPVGRGYFSMAHGSIDMPGCLPAQGPEPLLPVDARASSQLFGAGYGGFMGTDLGPQDAQEGFAVAALAQQSPAGDDSRSKSPQPIDIASRRNRRPAPLAIAGDRSHSSYAPRTATDLDRRGDRASPIRRVASTGAGRIRKPVAAPRSPFCDAKADLVFQTRRSPCTTGPSGTRAPPTPDTPVSLNHQRRIDEVVSYPLDAKYMPADLALEDPPLRTPPTTPGFVDSLFNIGPGYGMSVSEDTLISPGLDGLPGGFDMATMAGGVSGYAGSASDCSNHHAPSLLSPHMDPAYFGGLGGSTDYNWSDVSPSTSSSPGLDIQQAGYLGMNMTSTNLSHVEH